MCVRVGAGWKKQTDDFVLVLVNEGSSHTRTKKDNDIDSLKLSFCYNLRRFFVPFQSK